MNVINLLTVRTAPALSSMTIDRIRSETVISERSVEGGRSVFFTYYHVSS